MADFQQRDNSGAMFTNQRKVKDTHPDFNGSVMVGGVEYFMSGWKKVSKAGKPFISLAFTVKEASDAFDLGDSKPTPSVNDAFNLGNDDDLPY